MKSKIVKDAISLIRDGVYDQYVLFDLLQPRYRTHYSVVREAIHEAKVR